MTLAREPRTSPIVPSYGGSSLADLSTSLLASLTGDAPDSRLGEAVEHVRSRRSADGSWPLDWTPPGRVWFEVDDGAGKPSRWVTLRAMRVLSWWEQ